MATNNTTSSPTVDTGTVALTMGVFSIIFLGITSVVMIMIKKVLS